MPADPSRLLPALTPLAADEEPVRVLLRALRHIARVQPAMTGTAPERRMAFYLAAVDDLAETCENPSAVREAMGRTLPHSSTPVRSASAAQLRRATLALHGLACDRLGLTEDPIRYPRNLSAWLRAADRALALYVRPTKSKSDAYRI